MVVALNPEQEQVIDRAIEAGLIPDAKRAIEVGVATIRRQLTTISRGANELPHEVWSRKLVDFVNRERPAARLLSDQDVSRESIYGDRDL